WTGGGALELIVLPIPGGSGVLYNYGTLEVGGNCAFGFDFTPFGPGSVQNSGTISTAPGFATNSLTLNCNFTNYGTINVGTNSQLNLPGNQFSSQLFADGTVFDGPGTVRFFSDDLEGFETVIFLGIMTVHGTLDLE